MKKTEENDIEESLNKNKNLYKNLNLFLLSLNYQIIIDLIYFIYFLFLIINLFLKYYSCQV